MRILFDLFITFFKIGLFTIGGGYAMIPLITETVVNKGWCAETDIIDYIAVAESIPGPFSLNASTFIGMEQFGVAGAVSAALGLVMPSFIIILVIAKYLLKFLEYKGVLAALNGIRPAVIGLMVSAVVSIGLTAFNIDIARGLSNIDFIGVFIFLCVLGLYIISRKTGRFNMNAYKIILVSAVLGIIFYALRDFAFTVILQY
ncbi:MAG: chromate transporter [Oscillospiraceae bacterium]|nr:chromate transporter [Oscillospiraceae bacterium]